jgi:hypothetical protein
MEGHLPQELTYHGDKEADYGFLAPPERSDASGVLVLVPGGS